MHIDIKELLKAHVEYLPIRKYIYFKILMKIKLMTSVKILIYNIRLILKGS